MSEDCFGPVANWKRLKFGNCRECFDSNWAHDHHTYTFGRQRMIGRVCGHRLHPINNRPIMSRENRYIQTAREDSNFQEYWHRRALLPDYCGEPGELKIGFVPPFESWYRDQGKV